ncbi:MAG: hypothetical protein ACKO2Z_05170 [Sphaerospermopsis kisseleviana]
MQPGPNIIYLWFGKIRSKLDPNYPKLAFIVRIQESGVVGAKHSGDQLSTLCKGYFPVRAKHSGDKLSILITGYFPNASPLLRPYRSQESGVRIFVCSRNPDEQVCLSVCSSIIKHDSKTLIHSESCILSPQSLPVKLSSS